MMIELNGVTPVILGMLFLGPRSGYDIKRFVDNSTRFFWAASYGQIYPELRRLEQAGLIEGESAPTGGRQRRVYRLTAAGKDLLLDWLRSPALSYELRDEGLLKLFFADALPREEALGLFRTIRDRHRAVLDRLAEVGPYAKERGGFPYVVWQGGQALHSQYVAWCEEMENRLSADGKE
jgi:PadR family transcriptional regulator AphA